MRENHIAYKVTTDPLGLICVHSEFEDHHMLALLKEIEHTHSKDIYWVFKQLDGQSQEPLCIIDCGYNRIYYHYSGEVEKIADTIKKLNGESSC